MSRVQIYDTTLRDGSQGEGVYFSLQDKLLITAKLDELGFDFIQRLLPPFAKRACARAPGVVWGRDCQSCDLSVRQLP